MNTVEEGDSMASYLVYWYYFYGKPKLEDILIVKERMPEKAIERKKLYADTHVFKAFEETPDTYNYYLIEYTDYDTRIYRINIPLELEWILF